MFRLITAIAISVGLISVSALIINFLVGLPFLVGWVMLGTVITVNLIWDYLYSTKVVVDGK